MVSFNSSRVISNGFIIQPWSGFERVAQWALMDLGFGFTVSF
jgi:hypothetical protein